MKKIKTIIEDCYIIEVNKFNDDRGYFSTFYAEKDSLENELGSSIKGIVQGSRSLSEKGVLRGLHFQKDPFCQSKIVECLNGGVLDVVVDLRRDSSSYKKWISVELTPENGRQLLIPRGCAHGFLSLKDNTLFQYLVDSDYSKIHEDGIFWNDHEIGIDWQFDKYGIEKILLSEKDKNMGFLSNKSLSFFKKKRYLVTGVNGQLGYDIVRELNKKNIYDILALDINDMDITDKRIVNKIISEYKPEVVFHCAAWTNVENAEDCKEQCYKVNVEGTKNIVNACRNIDCKLIYISTDYVFDGEKDGLYEINDFTNPKNVYGKSKVAGENFVRSYEKSFIVRTSWLFGINGKNFINTMLKLSKTNEELDVVGNQIGSPTYTVDLAKTLIDISNTEKYGTYHVTNSGYCSWAELAKYIFEINNKNVKVNICDSYPSKAKRPSNSKLSSKSLIENGFEELPYWKNAVDRYNEESYQKIITKK